MEFKQLTDKVLTKDQKRYILSKIKGLLSKKAKKLPVVLDEISRSSGVYIIYHKRNNKIVYIGESDDLVRRLKGDLSRGKVRYNHTFLSKVAEKYNIPVKNEKKIKEIIKNNFVFSYVETISKEIAFVIEGILIRYMNEKCPDQLWNKIKKYQESI